MKVAILCEFSGIVRNEFLKLGHDAISCDFLPTESEGPHIMGDCLSVDWKGYDLLICHPPCTYLASSGLHWNTKRPERAKMTELAIEFVRSLWSLSVPRICIENPIGCLSTRWQKPTQIIQPWQFGHSESKATCLWLKNLPLLRPTNILERPASGRWSNQTPSGQNKLGPSKDRWKIRSTTYKGIAQAFAEQYGILRSKHGL